MKTKERTYAITRNFTMLGNYLQRQRRAAGFTQREVSNALGYSSAQFISNFERGIAAPPAKKLKTLINLYGLKRPEVIARLVRGYKEELSAALR